MGGTWARLSDFLHSQVIVSGPCKGTKVAGVASVWTLPEADPGLSGS